FARMGSRVELRTRGYNRGSSSERADAAVGPDDLARHPASRIRREECDVGDVPRVTDATERRERRELAPLLARHDGGQCRASSKAMPAPMPRDAPVTRATLSFSIV